MPDFDDEEYESFELEGKGGRTPTATAEVVEVVDDPEDVDEDDDDDDEPEDATEDEIDFVLAAYREDGQPLVPGAGQGPGQRPGRADRPVASAAG